MQRLIYLLLAVLSVYLAYKGYQGFQDIIAVGGAGPYDSWVHAAIPFLGGFAAFTVSVHCFIRTFKRCPYCKSRINAFDNIQCGSCDSMLYDLRVKRI